MRQETLTIGDVRLRLRATDDGFWSTMERFYQGFFTNDDAEPDETIEIAVVPDADLRLPKSGSFPSTRTERNGSLRITHGRGIAQWDRADHRAWVRQAESDYRIDLPRPDYVCSSLLIAILTRRLAAGQGCMIHAASLVRDGKGYLFVGPSGAGKSTIARLSAPTATVLSDDFSLVRRVADEIRVFGTPFLGEYEAVTADESAPLTAICFLRQASDNSLVPAARPLAVKELQLSVLLPGPGRAANQATLDLVVSITEHVPCHELHFLPDLTFWRCLDERNHTDPE